MTTAADADPALAVRCQRCGHALSPAALDDEVRCAACGHLQTLDPELLDRLARYRDAVSERQDAIDEQRRTVATWDRWYGRMRRGSGSTLLATGVLFTALPLLLGLGLWALSTWFGPLDERAMPYLSMGGMLLCYGSIGLFLLWMYSGRGRRREDPTIEATTLRCPGCGAPQPLSPGASASDCGHCGAPLVPTERAIEEGLQAAQRAEREARIARYRAERAAIAKVSSHGVGGSMYLFILGPFALMTGFGAVAFSVEMLRGTEPFSPAILLLWAMFAGVVAAGVGIGTWQRARRRRWRAALDALAAQFHGRPTAGVDGAVGWLNRYWAGPYDLTDLYCGTYGAGVELTVAGYAAYVYADPVAASQHHRAKVHLLLAAWIPGVSDRDDEGDGELPRGSTSEAREHAGWLTARHALSVTGAGLHVALDDADVRALRRDPGELAELAPSLARMATLARSLDATPVADAVPGGPPREGER